VVHVTRLSIENEVVYAGTETMTSSMPDNYFAAWNAKTIQYISDNMSPSLTQRPNVMLVHAGTNDMNSDPAISLEGNDPAGAVSRLDALIAKTLETCPDVVVLVAMPINSCHDPAQVERTTEFQGLIPDMVQKSYLDQGKKVVAVDFSVFPEGDLRSDDCVHPTKAGYALLGDYWYNFLTQVPEGWITEAVGDDPSRGP
jgi:lysophospholipase L1-like esterase